MTKSKLTTIVNFILDKSGSMDTMRDEVIQGYNKYLKELQSQEGKVLFTLTLFDTAVTHRHTMLPIKEVPNLTTRTYHPDGMTALYDAVVETIESVSAKVEKMEIKPAVLTVIMTDGQENSSQNHEQSCLTDLIDKLKKEGNWTFVFMGANQDSYATTKNIGVSASNTANWTAQVGGGSLAFASLSGQTVNYMRTMSDNSAKGVALNSSSFFDDKDKPNGTS